jgi:hypothetical protein
MDEEVECRISMFVEPENGQGKWAIPLAYWTVLCLLARGQVSCWALVVLASTTGLLLLFLSGRAWSLKNIVVMSFFAGLCGAGASLLGSPLMTAIPSFKFWAFLGAQGILVATQDRK